MVTWPEAKVFGDYFGLFARIGVQELIFSAKSFVHKKTYRALPNPRNVVVVGGSFAGIEVAQRLTRSLPTGYRVVLVERNTHFNYPFAFPRFSVFPGLESRAFVPYDNLASGAPEGIFQQVRGEALKVTSSQVAVTNPDSPTANQKIDYDYLVLATGAHQTSPTRLHAHTRQGGIAELQGFQKRIAAADRIAVVGGGAAGLELISDIRTRYPDKKLSLIHSRDHLLPRFDTGGMGHESKLRSAVVERLRQLDVEVLLNERPQLPENVGMSDKPTTLALHGGASRTWDLVLPCTGQRPYSQMLAPFSPKSIAPSGEILVRPTLQVDNLPSPRANIFALGDVAKSGGPKLGRSGEQQAQVVANNIVRMVKGKPNLKEYHPHYMERMLRLTMGKTIIMYTVRKGEEVLHLGNRWEPDVQAKLGWSKLHAKT